MKKKNLVTGVLALTLLFNTTGCSVQKTEHVSSQSIVEMLQTTYQLDGIYVVNKTLMTGEKELILTIYRPLDKLYFDILSLDKYDKNSFDKESVIPLIEYLTLDELKESYTYEELRSILQKLREEFHGVSYNPNIPFPYETFTEEKTESEEMYYANKIKIAVVKNEKDDGSEIYLTYPNIRIFNEDYGKSEFFTTVDFTDKNVKSFSVNDFIPASLIRNAYTEKELKALLVYVRELYHNNATIYDESPKLALTNED